MGVQQPFLVEPADAIATRFQARYQLRQLWQVMHNGYQLGAKEIALPAKMLHIDRRWLLKAMAQQVSFGALLEQIEQQQEAIGQQHCLVSIEQAMKELRLLLEPLRRRKASFQPKKHSQNYLLNGKPLPLIA
jgi:hypothetical protein